MDRYESAWSAAEKMWSGHKLPLYLRFWYIVRHFHIPHLLDDVVFDVEFYAKCMNQEKKFSSQHISQFRKFFTFFEEQRRVMLRLGFEIRWVDQEKDCLGIFASRNISINLQELDTFLSPGMKPECKLPMGFNSLITCMDGSQKMLLGVGALINEDEKSPLRLVEISTDLARNRIKKIGNEKSLGCRHITLHSLYYDDDRRPILRLVKDQQLLINYSFSE